MRTRALVLCLVFVGCRRKETAAPDPPAATVSAIASAIPSVAPALSPAPLAPVDPPVVVPAIACTESTTVAFRSSPDETFGCSPFKTSSAPLALTMAPGTTLELDLDVVDASEKAKAAKAADESSKNPDAEIDVPDVARAEVVRYTSSALPKGAVLDGEKRTLSWPVTGKTGDVFAFRVAAFAKVAGVEHCLTAPVVVHVKDDVARRSYQLARIAPRDSLSLPRINECGGFAGTPTMKDLDGDGLEDGFMTVENRYDNDSGETHVWFRRGDRFNHVVQLSRATQWYGTASGTSLFVARGGCCCHSDLDIWKVFSNRVESIASHDLAGDCADNRVEINLFAKDQQVTGYSLNTSSKAGNKSTQFDWDDKAKRFVKH